MLKKKERKINGVLLCNHKQPQNHPEQNYFSDNGLLNFKLNFILLKRLIALIIVYFSEQKVEIHLNAVSNTQ